MILTVPHDTTFYPTLGPQVCDFMEQNLVFGPGDLRGQPLILGDEFRALIYRMYEVFPPGHMHAGRRRFRRCGISLAKGQGKTELAAFITACELHPEAPVRCTGWTAGGEPIGGPVTDPYIPLVAYTEEQSDELCYAALLVILQEGPMRDDFDIGLQRVLRKKGDGKAVSLSSSPDARDGARTTFGVADEPLALDTPLPTPTGWITMGDVQAGDWVIGRDGKPCLVIGTSDVQAGRPCYRVTFGDGTSVVADAAHLWSVYDNSPSYRHERIVRTEDLFRFTWAKNTRFRVVEPKPMDTPDVELPVDPYVLGLWLGDGDQRNATISVGDDDLSAIEQNLQIPGYKVTRCTTKKDRCALLYVTFNNSRKGNVGSHSVVGALRRLGVLRDKHIPASYLRAGLRQRLALLQGLMDSDGWIGTNGTCAFVNSNLRLVEGTAELLRTLGYRPNSPCSRLDTRWKKPCTTYKLHFTANESVPPFRLERKRSRIRVDKKTQRKGLAVAGVERTDSVPVKCIAVDNDDRLFLAGPGMMPTHNTHRWTLPRLREAHKVMINNLAKRKIAQPWMLEITTAPEPGEGSVAESTMDYAKHVSDGRVLDTSLFFFHRQASDDHDLETPEGRRAAVVEASGASAEWRDIDAIVAFLDDPGADVAYWERVWCNRLVKGATQAFNVEHWKTLKVPDNPCKPGDMITVGFDGAKFFDSTGLVVTHLATGYQWVAGIWECPPGQDRLPDGRTPWQVPADEVDIVVHDLFERFTVVRFYADPPYWQELVAKWVGEFGKERVIEWWTNRRRQMASALEGFQTALKEKKITHDGDKRYQRHLGNARKEDLPGWRNEEGKPLWLIRKERPDSPNKMDLAVAGVLSWEARTDAIAAGALSKKEPQYQMIIMGGGR